MKKTTIILMLLTIVSALSAQIDTNFNTTLKEQQSLKKSTIQLEIDVIADMRSINDSISISLVYQGFGQTISGPNKFKIYLNYNTDYYIQISAKDYTSKLLRVDTRNARKNNWELKAVVNLVKSSQEVAYVGGFAYRNNSFTKIH